MSQGIKNNNSVKSRTRSVQYVSIPLGDNPSSSPRPRRSAETATLRDAIAWKDVALCEKLLQRGDDVNVKDDDDASLLHFLARKYSKSETRARKIPSLLLEHGADVYARDKNGDTPLHIVAREGLDDFCQVLLEHIASNSPRQKLDIKNKKNMTALHLAAQQGNDSIVQRLLKAGSDPRLIDSQKFLPIHHAAEGGKVGCCRLLSESYAGDAKMDPKVPTPLMLAARRGFHQSIEAVPREKIDFNRQDEHGNTALHTSARLGLENFVKYLLDMKCDINIKNKTGNTPLMEVAAKGRTSCLLLLLEHGAKVEETNRSKRSVLHIASDRKSAECLEYLLNNDGVKKIIDRQDYDGCTALRIAIKKDSERCAMFLLRAGASSVLACNNKISPMHLAADNTRTTVLEYLLANNPQDVNPEDLNKETPFHRAAKRGLRDTCILLLRKGARLNAVNNHGQTALHLSAYHGQSSVVKFLIKRGIDKRLKDEAGSLALHAAATKGHIECCKILVEADRLACRAKNKKNFFPIDYAFNRGHNSVFQFLLHNMPFKTYSILPQDLREKLHCYTHKALKDRNKYAIEMIADSIWWEAGFVADQKHDSLCTNFRELIKLYPSIALKVMEKCSMICPTTSVKTYDFRLFEEKYYIKKEKRKDLPTQNKDLRSAREVDTSDLQWRTDHPVNLMITNRRPQLLQHPLTKAWLNNKWESYTKYIFFVMLLLQAFYAASLVAFMVTVWNWKQIENKYNNTEKQVCGAVMNSTANLSQGAGVLLGSGESSIPWDPTPSRNCHIILAVAFLFHFLFEFNNFIKLRWSYFNYSSMVTMACMVLTVFTLWSTTWCSFTLCIKSVLLWECGIFALIMISIGIISNINKLPSLSVFTAISRDFVMSYLKGLAYVSAILLVFALIFHLLLQEVGKNTAFSSVPEAAVKTVVWMLGELEYEGTFIGKPLDYPNLSKCLFIFFLFTIAAFIVMLLRTPTSDINKLTFYRLARQAEMFLTIDVCFPVLKRRFAVDHFRDVGIHQRLLQKAKQMFKARQREGLVVQNLSIIAEKMGLIDVRKYREPPVHWLVLKLEAFLDWLKVEEEEDQSQEFPNIIHEKLSDQTRKLDELLALFNQLHDNYQKQNEQIIELKNQLDNIKLQTF